jgi:hypothetical protein
MTSPTDEVVVCDASPVRVERMPRTMRAAVTSTRQNVLTPRLLRPQGGEDA